MPLLRSAIAAGLLVIGLHILVAAAATEAVAASDCPCIKSRGACVPDPACERVRRGRGEYHYRVRRDREGAVLKIQRTRVNPQYRNPPSASPAIVVRPPPPAPPPVVASPPPQAPPGPAVDPSWHPTAAPTVPGSKKSVSTRARPRILETGYSHLTELGKEVDGYGLYSYAILPSDSNRAALFLGQLFKQIPSIGDTSAQLSQLNIFYVPLRKDKEADFTAALQTLGHDAAKLGAEYTKSFYDYRMARALLNHVCNPPDRSVLDLCNTELSRGPYIFTYASPASKIEPVPPPFLFVDLSDVHERAFGELLAAFQAQVKREDISDQARIRTMRLNILQVALTAADWVSPVQKAIADIVRGSDKK